MEAQLYPEPNDKEEEEKRKKKHTQIMTLIILPCTLLLPPFSFFVTSTTSSKESYTIYFVDRNKIYNIYIICANVEGSKKKLLESVI